MSRYQPGKQGMCPRMFEKRVMAMLLVGLIGCGRDLEMVPVVSTRAGTTIAREGDARRAPATAMPANAPRVAARHDGAAATGSSRKVASRPAAGTRSPAAAGQSASAGIEIVVAFDYDEAFRLSEIRVQDLPAIGLEYDLDDHLTRAGPLTIERHVHTGFPQATRAGAVVTAYEISEFAEPSRITTTFAGQVLLDTAYTRDKLGRITHLDETIAGQSRSITYGYDLADRLASVHQQGQPPVEYRYHPNGNLVSLTGMSMLNVVATHDVQDRLLAHGDLAFTYTPAGYVRTKRDTRTGALTVYQYDEIGNLLAVLLPDGRSLRYLIDGEDRRVAKLVDGQYQWHFAYAFGLPVARVRPDGSVESQYVYGAHAHVPDVVIKDGRAYRLVTDHLGSPRLVVDVETGAIAQRLDYDVFGRVLADTSPGFQPFGFAGGLYDPDTGLVRFGARDYDPAVGRWTGKDPAGFGGGDTNLYAYAFGDPVNYVDPSGEIAFLAPLVIAAFKGALAGAAIGGGIELAADLVGNGGNIDCVDWGGVIGGGAHGALWGAGGGALFQGLGRATTALRGFHNAARGGVNLRPDVALSGGRSGHLVKDLVGPANSAVRGGGARTFVTNERGQVILDITANRVKPVVPGQGFGPKRPPTSEELDLLNKVLGGGL
jgi:RHS repeat-associated protein